jgi:hypothetical protein
MRQSSAVLQGKPVFLGISRSRLVADHAGDQPYPNVNVKLERCTSL